MLQQNLAPATASRRLQPVLGHRGWERLPWGRQQRQIVDPGFATARYCVFLLRSWKILFQREKPISRWVFAPRHAAVSLLRGRTFPFPRASPQIPFHTSSPSSRDGIRPLSPAARGQPRAALTPPEGAQIAARLRRAAVAELGGERFKILFARFDLLDVAWKKRERFTRGKEEETKPRPPLRSQAPTSRISNLKGDSARTKLRKHPQTPGVFFQPRFPCNSFPFIK